MSGWGTGEWGTGPWGGIGDAGVGAPAIDSITTPEGTVTVNINTGGGEPNFQPLPVLDILGGDVMTITGVNFVDPMLVELLQGGFVKGTGYIFDARYDIFSTKLFAGSPPLPTGMYDVRLTNSAGSATLLHAVYYTNFANELKIERVRIGFAKVWEAGLRFLRGG